MTPYISAYISPKFTNEIRKQLEPNLIIELGARDGMDSVQLSKTYPNAKIMAFEANPKQSATCLSNVSSCPSIEFFGYAVGSVNTSADFQEYVLDGNIGASSLLKRYDYDRSQKTSATIPVVRLETVLQKKQVNKVDIIFADIQGYELEALRGAGKYLETCDFVLLEVPVKESVYVGAPNFTDTISFMNKNDFDIVVTEYENDLESNILFKKRK